MTFKLQVEIDPSEEGGRERAHAAVDAVYDFAENDLMLRIREALRLDDDEDAPPSSDEDTDDAGRTPLAGKDLRQFLITLALGTEERTPLNGGEREMLRAIAERAPEPLPYEENRAMFGTGQRFGNVSSGLTRRFRGYELPYDESPDGTGYAMSADSAAIVLSVLDETEG